MQTQFAPAQLKDPMLAHSAKIVARCVHCGMCTSSCPTYVLLGDERDSPRGRIYFIKEMLERNLAPTPEIVTHIDRCLSCLACLSVCPAGVDYQHLIDHGRAHIEKRYRRVFGDRLFRWLLARLLPNSWPFWLALAGARALRPLEVFLPKRWKNLLILAPKRFARPARFARLYPARGPRRMRVGLLTGCVQNVLAPQINRATIRLLNRLRAEVVVPDGVGCCGALTHHMGREADSSPLMLANIRAFRAEMQAQGLDAIVANASGCGTQLKDYGFIFRLDPAWAEPAAEVSSLARDITEVVAELGLPPGQSFPKMSLAYQSACSLKNGQKIEDLPIQLLERSGFSVRVVPEGHMCCGSAGTYNLLQPDIAERLRRRKIEAIKSLGSDAVAAGNIGCIVQLGRDNEIPIAHTVEFLDWATGGPKPVGLGG